MAKVWVGTREFPSKASVTAEYQRILAKYPGDAAAVPAGSQRVTGSDDEAFIRDLIASHPDIVEKTGSGIDHFEVRHYDFGTRGVCLVRTDGTDIDVSLPWSVKHLPTTPPQ
ncbi:DCL family protein [Streptomyces phaeochromogenes]|uniref:DCL family protein n=1 Tax=Streptomyces phaeochromogenes TaxID=1923 RepID=A0ABZ1HAF7_STRPH|nr:DUF3223 domain-containing protein [Streptomyces phaeochromogenes]WSD14316.1 DCL family protein [Streptomyces phaeochromogenes]